MKGRCIQGRADFSEPREFVSLHAAWEKLIWVFEHHWAAEHINVQALKSPLVSNVLD